MRDDSLRSVGRIAVLVPTLFLADKIGPKILHFDYATSRIVAVIGVLLFGFVWAAFWECKKFFQEKTINDKKELNERMEKIVNGKIII